jgi:hypothetical protein
MPCPINPTPMTAILCDWLEVDGIALNPLFVTPAKAGVQRKHWMPAFAGMTMMELRYTASTE